MQIKAIKKVDGCLEGTNIYDIFTDTPVTVKFVKSFAGNTNLKIYTSGFDKSFYRLIFPGKITVKGSIGICSMRCILPDNQTKENLNEFLRLVKAYC